MTPPPTATTSVFRSAGNSASGIVQFRRRRQRFRRFAGGQHQPAAAKTRLFQRIGNRIGMTAHMLIGDDQGERTRDGRNGQRRQEIAGGDGDVVRAGAEGDAEGSGCSHGGSWNNLSRGRTD